VYDTLVSDHAVEQNEERYDQLSYLDFRQYCGQSSTSREPALKLYSKNFHYSVAEREAVAASVYGAAVHY
jgi:hypothetical protein